MKRQFFFILLFLGSIVGSSYTMQLPDMDFFGQQTFARQQYRQPQYPRFMPNQQQYPMYNNPYGMMMQQPNMYGMMNPFGKDNQKKLSVYQYATNELTMNMMQGKPLSYSVNRIVDYSIQNVSSYCKSWWLQAIVTGALYRLKISALPKIAQFID